MAVPPTMPATVPGMATSRRKSRPSPGSVAVSALDRFLELLRGLIRPPPVFVDVPREQVTLIGVRVEADRLVQLLEGRVQCLLRAGSRLEDRPPQPGVEVAFLRVEADRLLEGPPRLGVLPPAHQLLALPEPALRGDQ